LAKMSRFSARQPSQDQFIPAYLTVIGDNTIIGISSNIGHDVQIGKNCSISSNCVIARKAKLENGVWVGPSSTIREHVNIGPNSQIKLGSVVIEDVKASESVSGNFALNHPIHLRNYLKKKRDSESRNTQYLGESKMQHHVKIVAEIGSNYDGDLNLAKKYISAAAECGADMVKFQTLKKDQLIAPKVIMGGELKDNPVYQNFASLELPDEWHFSLKTFANQNNIEFFSTPFYLEAVELLERVGIHTYKIASGDITFFPLLKAVGKTGKDVILSTGGSNLADVENALNVLTDSGSGNITLLHCVSSYPPRFNEMNLKTIGTLKAAFDLPVGISDHTPGSLIPSCRCCNGCMRR
jgi:carbonic anhydrase/acetyltransferase-like protein (isoleucine patch superfamily)